MESVFQITKKYKVIKMAFRKFGGLEYNKTNNYVSSNTTNNMKLNISDHIGKLNTKIVVDSHLDLNNQSMFNVGNIYFSNGADLQSLADNLDLLSSNNIWTGVNTFTKSTNFQGNINAVSIDVNTVLTTKITSKQNNLILSTSSGSGLQFSTPNSSASLISTGPEKLTCSAEFIAPTAIINTGGLYIYSDATMMSGYTRFVQGGGQLGINNNSDYGDNSISIALKNSSNELKGYMGITPNLIDILTHLSMNSFNISGVKSLTCGSFISSSDTGNTGATGQVITADGLGGWSWGDGGGTDGVTSIKGSTGIYVTSSTGDVTISTTLLGTSNIWSDTNTFSSQTTFNSNIDMDDNNITNIGKISGRLISKTITCSATIQMGDDDGVPYDIDMGNNDISRIKTLGIGNNISGFLYSTIGQTGSALTIYNNSTYSYTPNIAFMLKNSIGGTITPLQINNNSIDSNVDIDMNNKDIINIKSLMSAGDTGNTGATGQVITANGSGGWSWKDGGTDGVNSITPGVGISVSPSTGDVTISTTLLGTSNTFTATQTFQANPTYPTNIILSKESQTPEASITYDTNVLTIDTPDSLIISNNLLGVPAKATLQPYALGLNLNGSPIINQTSLNTALAPYATTASLGTTYAQLTGADFTGSISTTGGISATSGKINGYPIVTSNNLTPALDRYALLDGADFNGEITAPTITSNGAISALAGTIAGFPIATSSTLTNYANKATPNSFTGGTQNFNANNNGATITETGLTITQNTDIGKASQDIVALNGGYPSNYGLAIWCGTDTLDPSTATPKVQFWNDTTPTLFNGGIDVNSVAITNGANSVTLQSNTSQTLNVIGDLTCRNFGADGVTISTSLTSSGTTTLNGASTCPTVTINDPNSKSIVNEASLISYIKKMNGFLGNFRIGNGVGSLAIGNGIYDPSNAGSGDSFGICVVLTDWIGNANSTYIFSPSSINNINKGIFPYASAITFASTSGGNTNVLLCLSTLLNTGAGNYDLYGSIIAMNV